MRAMRICAFVLLTAAAAYGSPPQPGPADLNRVAAGVPAPDFTLESQDGSRVTLAEFRGKKRVVLVFYRGQW